jgi:hypothetical protein
MKTVRAELTSEGRLDVLDRVMSYRGGKTVIKIHSPISADNSILGYSQEVLLFFKICLRLH